MIIMNRRIYITKMETEKSIIKHSKIGKTKTLSLETNLKGCDESDTRLNKSHI